MNPPENQREVGKFRKKPVVVEAMRVKEIIALAIEKGPGGMPEWLVQAMAGASRLRTLSDPESGGFVQVRTKQGQWISADPDEWIVCAAPDDLWPVDPDVFEETYEPA